MIPWKQLDVAPTPDGKNEVILLRRGQEFSIRVDGQELMNSRMFSSEKVLAKLACNLISHRRGAKVVIGGLGMGFTLASALNHLESDARVIQVELLPAMVQWHDAFLGHLCDHAVTDQRVEIVTQDIIPFLNNGNQYFDAIILDVDNGPEGLTQTGNNNLYNKAGLGMLKGRLAPGGVLAVWSAKDCAPFTQRLKLAGFDPKVHTVSARPNNKGGKHTIWIATAR
ncbi:Spermine/spermidine synthase [Desulfocicer vacuolatum DSM 3385]|uniref:Spermine/spermidine synthase n=1 Tax=Desulfocicer vacuolatum DSM 3385 TaxID=1121400 RepID=A0A1W2CGZ8_9BACT|nr:hypothetical protein [Desulfocicer vacuolatum]SMC84441.1 Spermine/spermidine synthase [Desulfocicer vacuolatum DSM 3385]